MMGFKSKAAILPYSACVIFKWILCIQFTMMFFNISCFCVFLFQGVEKFDVTSSAQMARQSKMAANAPTSVTAAPSVKMENVHLRTEEKLTCVVSRDGGVDALEVHGVVTLRVAQPDLVAVTVHMDNQDASGAQIQVTLSRRFSRSSSVHLRTEEKLTCVVSRDGGVDALEVHGVVTLRVAQPDLVAVTVHMDNQDASGAQIQVTLSRRFSRSSSVHLRTEEKLTCVVSRDGGVDALEVHGVVTLRVAQPDLVAVTVHMDNQDASGAQIQVTLSRRFSRSSSGHLRTEEKLTCVVSRDGGVDALEVHGVVTLRVAQPDLVAVTVHMDNQDASGAQIQVTLSRRFSRSSSVHLRTEEKLTCVVSRDGGVDALEVHGVVTLRVAQPDLVAVTVHMDNQDASGAQIQVTLSRRFSRSSSVHLRTEEKLTCVVSRDGGVDALEVHGVVTLRVAQPDLVAVTVHMDNQDASGAQIQVTLSRRFSRSSSGHLRTEEKLTCVVSRDGGVDALEVHGVVTLRVAQPDLVAVTVHKDNQDASGAQIQVTLSRRFSRSSSVHLRTEEKLTCVVSRDGGVDALEVHGVVTLRVAQPDLVAVTVHMDNQDASGAQIQVTLSRRFSRSSSVHLRTEEKLTCVVSRDGGVDALEVHGVVTLRVAQPDLVAVTVHMDNQDASGAQIQVTLSRRFSRSSSVHLRTEEKLTCVVSRDGGVDALEVHGVVTLRVAQPDLVAVTVHMDNQDASGAQIQVTLSRRFSRSSSVHLRTEEKLTCVVSRDGGVDALEVHGVVTLRVAQPDLVAVTVHMDNQDASDAQIQVTLSRRFSRSSSVHLRTEEKLTCVVSRDGGVDALEVHGVVTLRVAQPDLVAVTVHMDNQDASDAQIQVTLSRRFSRSSSVHLRTEEKLTCVVSRDGGVDALEVHGVVTLRVASGTQIQVTLSKRFSTSISSPWLVTHPNLDKKAWQAGAVLQLKSAQKPFPVNSDVGVLKWRFQTTDEAHVPLSINCWPSETSQGCDVNIEYTLENENLELRDLTITIPLPSGAVPVVGECEGEFRHDKQKSVLVWTPSATLVDRDARTGTLEFTTAHGHADHFFPLRVYFSSPKLFCDIRPRTVTKMDDDAPIVFSQESSLFTEKYEIV